MWTPWTDRDRNARERDLERELRDHLALEAEERDGDMPAARRALGNPANIKADTRDEWGGMALERLWQDLRFAARTMRRRPAFVVSAVLILALGIGINTAAYTLVRAVVLTPLPFPNPDELVIIRKEWTEGAAPYRFSGVAPGDFLDLQDRVTSVSELAGYYSRELTATGVREPYRVNVAAVSSNFFRLFGVEPALGRDRLGEVSRSSPPVAILSHALWRERFGSQPSVIDSNIVLNGTPYTVVAVMRPDFVFPQIQGDGPNFDLWISQPQDAAWRAQRGPNYVTMFARLGPAASLSAARGEMKIISQQFAIDQPEFFRGKALTMTPLRDQACLPVSRVSDATSGVVVVSLMGCSSDSDEAVRAPRRRSAHGWRARRRSGS